MFAGVLPWLGFGALVLVLLAVDLGLFHRKSSVATVRQAARWTAVWCLLALAFNVFIWYWRGRVAAVQFLTGYVLEWSLSMDNVFVFAVLFNYFQVPPKYQYRVLFWGILGAVVLRLSFVLLGTTLIHYFHWVLPLFGLILVYQGGKLAFEGDEDLDPEVTLMMRLSRRLLPIAQGEYGELFFVRESGRWMITRLFLVLLVIDWVDVVFAVDSVPAIFGVTTDPFIIFTSNVFAILGLRALYFLLAAVMDLFHYLKYGLSGVLVVIGATMIAEYFVPGLVSQWVKLAVVVGLLGLSVAASLILPRPQPKEEEPEADDGGTPGDDDGALAHKDSENTEV